LPAHLRRQERSISETNRIAHHFPFLNPYQRYFSYATYQDILTQLNTYLASTTTAGKAAGTAATSAGTAATSAGTAATSAGHSSNFSQLNTTMNIGTHFARFSNHGNRNNL
jgi:hypothetical protein